MNRVAVAQELVKLARELSAEYKYVHPDELKRVTNLYEISMTHMKKAEPELRFAIHFLQHLKDYPQYAEQLDSLRAAFEELQGVIAEMGVAKPETEE